MLTTIRTTMVVFFLGVGVSVATAAAPLQAPDDCPTVSLIKQRGKILVGNSFKFPRFNSLNQKTGEYEGFMADLARELSRKLFGDPNRIDWQITGNEDDLSPVIYGNVDVIIDAKDVGVRFEKAQMVNFSQESARTGPALLVKRGSRIQSLDDVDNRTKVLYVKTGEHDLALVRFRNPKAVCTAYDTYEQAFAALVAGKGDVLVGYSPYLYGLAASNPKYTLTGKFSERYCGIISRKGDECFAKYLDTVVAEWKASGGYERSYRKWLSPLGGDLVR